MGLMHSSVIEIGLLQGGGKWEPKPSHSGNEYLRDQFILRRGARIVGVVLNGKIIAKLDSQHLDKFPNAPRYRPQLRVRADERKAAVLATRKMLVAQTRGQPHRWRIQ